MELYCGGILGINFSVVQKKIDGLINGHSSSSSSPLIIRYLLELSLDTSFFLLKPLPFLCQLEISPRPIGIPLPSRDYADRQRHFQCCIQLPFVVVCTETDHIQTGWRWMHRQQRRRVAEMKVGGSVLFGWASTWVIIFPLCPVPVDGTESEYSDDHPEILSNQRSTDRQTRHSASHGSVLGPTIITRLMQLAG